MPERLSAFSSFKMSANRKLAALRFPEAENFNVEEECQYFYVIGWLENHVIGCYPVEQRANITNSKAKNWISYYEKYLIDTECPCDSSNHPAVLDYLLNLALRLRFEDNKAEFIGKRTKLSSTPAFADLNLEDSKLCELVNELANLLKITIKANDTLTTLKAIELVIEENISCSPLKPDQKSFHFDLQSIPVGLVTNDSLIKTCSAILRLLYIKDLRQLQTVINNAIAKAQLITADPKTDTKLAKVGF